MHARTHSSTKHMLPTEHSPPRQVLDQVFYYLRICLPPPSLQCSSAPVNGAHTDPAKHVLLLSHIGAGPEFTLSSTVPAQHMQTWDRPQTSALPGTLKKVWSSLSRPLNQPGTFHDSGPWCLLLRAPSWAPHCTKGLEVLPGLPSILFTIIWPGSQEAVLSKFWQTVPGLCLQIPSPDNPLGNPQPP